MPTYSIQDVLDVQFNEFDSKTRRNTLDLRKVMNKLPPEEVVSPAIPELTLSESWDRSSSFTSNRIYHTDITPPSDAEIIYIDPTQVGKGTLCHSLFFMMSGTTFQIQVTIT